jgi:hypothetical protein
VQAVAVISGTVTGDGGAPLVGIEVQGDADGYSALDVTAADGSYALAVAAGTYTISFFDPSGSYLGGFYAGAQYVFDAASSTGIVVTDADVPGINAHLPHGHAITGTVTGAGGAALADVLVEADAPGQAWTGTTGADGTYTVEVPSGSFTIQFHEWAGDYLDGYYSSGGFVIPLAAANVVPVTSADVGGISVQMPQGMLITGSVTGGGGALGGILVEASSTGYTGDSVTADDGSYAVRVASGTYRVKFTDPSGTYVTGWYSTSGFTTAAASATPIQVSSGDVAGINVSMTTGRVLSGMVTGADGMPLESIHARVQGSGVDQFTSTDSNGAFDLTVPPGTYTLFLDDWTGSYQSGYYDGAGSTVADQASAYHIVVGVADVGPLDIQLVGRHRITGTVWDLNYNPLGYVLVEALTGGDVVNHAITASDGTYALPVPVGSYLLRFTDPSGTYPPGYYSTTGIATDYADASTVEVVSGDATYVDTQLTTWFVSVSASAAHVPAGGTITVTANANGDVGPTSYYLVILEDGIPVRVCGSGTTCSVGLTSAFSSSDWLQAVVANSDGSQPQGASPGMLVSWDDVTKPVVTAPVASVALGATLGSTTVPVSLAWSGGDADTGVDHYDVAMSTSGGSFVRLGSVTSPSYMKLLAPSSTRTYRFEVRAIDRAGNASAWAVGPSFHVKLYQETSTTFRYSGTWHRNAGSSASGGNYKYATQKGSSVTGSFTGRSLAIVAYRGSALGRLYVYVDGHRKATVNLYSSATQWRRVVYSATWSSSAKHTVKLVWAGTSARPRVDLDALVDLG